jgi:hypothetical protein
MATDQALHRVSGAVAIVLAAFLGTSLVSADPFQEELRRRVEASVTAAPIEAGDEPIYSVVTIRDFYERRSFEPAWIAGGKPPRTAPGAAVKSSAGSAAVLVPESVSRPNWAPSASWPCSPVSSYRGSVSTSPHRAPDRSRR